MPFLSSTVERNPVGVASSKLISGAESIMPFTIPKPVHPPTTMTVKKHTNRVFMKMMLNFLQIIVLLAVSSFSRLRVLLLP